MPESVEIAPDQKPALKTKSRRRMFIIWGVCLLNVGLLTFLLIQLLTPASSKSASNPLLNRPAPDFSLAMLHPQSGKSTLSLADFKGKPIVLNFWASWCDPCKQEAPLLESSWKEMQAQGKDVVFLGIDFEESRDAAMGFVEQYKITYPIVLDTGGSAAAKYYITSLPDTIFINRDGTVVDKVTQQLTAQLLSSGLKLIT
jgi:cytochrome c biogenesis protein CcmG/thiol:disulfide interchange protein DsbE